MVGKEQLDIENPEKVGWPEQEKAREELLALQYQINPVQCCDIAKPHCQLFYLNPFFHLLAPPQSSG